MIPPAPRCVFVCLTWFRLFSALPAPLGVFQEHSVVAVGFQWLTQLDSISSSWVLHFGTSTTFAGGVGTCLNDFLFVLLGETNISFWKRIRFLVIFLGVLCTAWWSINRLWVYFLCCHQLQGCSADVLRRIFRLAVLCIQADSPADLWPQWYFRRGLELLKALCTSLLPS